MISGIGIPEVLIVLVLGLIVLGPKKLPEMGKSLGKGMREFKDSVTGSSRDEELPELATVVETPAAAPGQNSSASLSAARRAPSVSTGR